MSALEGKLIEVEPRPRDKEEEVNQVANEVYKPAVEESVVEKEVYKPALEESVAEKEVYKPVVETQTKHEENVAGKVREKLETLIKPREWLGESEVAKKEVYLFPFGDHHQVRVRVILVFVLNCGSVKLLYSQESPIVYPFFVTEGLSDCPCFNCAKEGPYASFPKV